MRVPSRTVGFSIAAVLVVAGAVFLATRGPGENPTPLRAGVLRHEGLIAQCMQRHGFEYIVSVPADVVAEEAAKLAAKEGRDVEAAKREARQQAPPNPNDALVGKLSPERQLAWGDALFGTDTTEGCYYETYKAAWGVDLAAVAAKGEEHLARVKADPAVRQAERTYLDCMTARGFRVSTTEEIFAQMARQRESLDAARADAFDRDAEAAHKTCIGPYDAVFDRVYVRLSAGQR